MASADPGEAFARRRLRRDWAEVLREPSSLVAASPLENNIFEWHANLRPSTGPLAGATFHVRITFPRDYPRAPPNLHFPQSEIPSFVHPNLYDFGLCLDILSSFVGEEDQHAGWSPAYTVRTLLMQLQSFLFEFDRAPQDYGGTKAFHYSKQRVSDVRAQAAKLVCWKCGHCQSNPQPPLQPPPVVVTQSTSSASSNSKQQLSRSTFLEAGPRFARIKAELSALEAWRPSAEYQGAGRWRSGDQIAHLAAPGRQLRLRIASLHAKGGLRIGLGTRGCTGLTEGMERSGSVAWDFQGKLLVGSMVFEGALPCFAVGDTVSVQLSASGDLSLTRNGSPVVHDSSKLALRGSLDSYLVSQGLRGSRARAPRVMLSFRNAEVEVLDSPGELQDELKAAAHQRRSELKEQYSRDEAKFADLRAHFQEVTSRILRERRAGLLAGPWASGLPGELLLTFLMAVDQDDVPALRRVCTSWRQLVEGHSLLERLQLCCFYTKASPSQDTLGFGVSAEYHNDGNLKALATELDVLSLTAFSQFGLRRGAWGEDFEYFLPLVLDGSHATRALPLLEQSLACLAVGGLPPQGIPRCFQPWMALAVLPQLMNSFVVSLMNTQGDVTRHASEKALLGYCSFHHMLLSLARRHPSIIEVAEEKLRAFLLEQNGRDKAHTPDLGQLLLYCTLSARVGWEQLAPAFIEESTIRSVMWLLREQPSLELPGLHPEALLRATFRGRLTGLRLLMFQSFFLRLVGRGSRQAGQSCLELELRRYAQQFSLPTQEQKESLFQAAKEIMAVSSWSGFYERLGLQSPTAHQQAESFRCAVQVSTSRGYHRPLGRTRGPGGRLPVGCRPTPAVERVGVAADLQKAFKKNSEAKAMQSRGPKPQKPDALKPKPQAQASKPCLMTSNRFCLLGED